MTEAIKLLDVVALTEDVSKEKLRRGEVGTVVEILRPDVFGDGQTYAMATLRNDQLMVLHYKTARAAG